MPTKLDRRSFLQNAALAGAALAVPTVLKSETPENPTIEAPAIFSEKIKDKLRIGFIGTGYRGQSHVELALMRDDCEITAIADPDPLMIADTLKMIADKGRKKPTVYDKSPQDYL
ncbi:MAG: hypothetical protein RIQ78_1756, partial [Bacteroidota bacterium]